MRKKHARRPPPHGGRRTDQRKGTRLIFLGQDRGCGNGPVKRAVLSGNANEPGDGDGGPREGSLSCLTVSRKGTASCLAASSRIQTRGAAMYGASRALPCCRAETQHNDPGIGSPGERVR